MSAPSRGPAGAPRHQLPRSSGSRRSGDRRAPRSVAVLAVLALLLAGCGSVVAGRALPGSTEISTPTDNSPSGLKKNAPAPTLRANDADVSNSYDRLALSTIQDLYTFYGTEMPAQFDKQFTPAKVLQSYDSRSSDASFCGRSVKGEVNAFYSSGCDGIAWDRGELMPSLQKEVGELAVPTVLAHEMGHLVQARLGVPRSSTLLLEQQADCYAGAYWRWVSAGNSKYFTFGANTGMRGMLSALQYVADPVGLPPQTQGAHGSAFDRVFAATLGFTGGAKRCNQITQAEVEQRVKANAFSQIPRNYGNLDVTEELVADVARTLDQYFGETVPGYQAPTLKTYTGEAPPACSGTAQTGPVAFCPATRTVSYNLAELQKIGASSGSWSTAKGDFTAMIILASRYALAAIAGSGGTVTDPRGGLQALCYAGTWANWLRTPRGPKNLALSPNDLDKAVLEVITSPRAATDVSGGSTGSVLAQVQALNVGVVYDITTCFDYYTGSGSGAGTG